MVNHARALAGHGASVLVIGTGDTPVDEDVARHPHIRIARLHDIGRAGERASRLGFLIVTAARFSVLHAHLWWRLLWGSRPSAVLVQTPPAFPTLACVLMASWLRRARAIVDWHNLGYSMLALRFEPTSPLVRVAAAYERACGRRFRAHLCVSEAMQRHLAVEFGVSDSRVLHDRPLRVTPALTRDERTVLAARVLEKAGLAFKPTDVLVVCPTSWTADEDMSLLLDALAHRDARTPHGPRLVVVVTGLGPRRQAFEQRLASTRYTHATVHTAFFEPAAYRDVLRAADLGLCFHTSSSGVDLPMKVIDFFGAHTPICAYDYGPCLREQIAPGVTARLFTTGSELAAHLVELFAGFPDDVSALERMRAAVAVAARDTWFDAWDRTVAPLIPGLRAR